MTTHMMVVDGSDDVEVDYWTRDGQVIHFETPKGQGFINLDRCWSVFFRAIEEEA